MSRNGNRACQTGYAGRATVVRTKGRRWSKDSNLEKGMKILNDRRSPLTF